MGTIRLIDIIDLIKTGKYKFFELGFASDLQKTIMVQDDEILAPKISPYLYLPVVSISAGMAPGTVSIYVDDLRLSAIDFKEILTNE